MMASYRLKGLAKTVSIARIFRQNSSDYYCSDNSEIIEFFQSKIQHSASRRRFSGIFKHQSEHQDVEKSDLQKLEIIIESIQGKRHVLLKSIIFYIKSQRFII